MAQLPVIVMCRFSTRIAGSYAQSGILSHKMINDKTATCVPGHKSRKSFSLSSLNRLRGCWAILQESRLRHCGIHCCFASCDFAYTSSFYLIPLKVGCGFRLALTGLDSSIVLNGNTPFGCCALCEKGASDQREPVVPRSAHRLDRIYECCQKSFARYGVGRDYFLFPSCQKFTRPPGVRPNFEGNSSWWKLLKMTCKGFRCRAHSAFRQNHAVGA